MACCHLLSNITIFCTNTMGSATGSKAFRPSGKGAFTPRKSNTLCRCSAVNGAEPDPERSGCYGSRNPKHTNKVAPMEGQCERNRMYSGFFGMACCHLLSNITIFCTNTMGNATGSKAFRPSGKGAFTPQKSNTLCRCSAVNGAEPDPERSGCYRPCYHYQKSS